MKDITRNEMLIILKIFKTPERDFNANNISKEVGITPMGALKILKRLEKEGIVVPKSAGKAVFYKINFSNDYAKEYVKFVIRREAEHASAYLKRWIHDIRKLKGADIAIVFGSVLEKDAKSNDVDVLVVTSQNRFEDLRKEIIEMNKINEKNIHAVYQSSKDLKDNIMKQDKVVLNALKGVVALGEDKLIELVK